MDLPESLQRRIVETGARVRVGYPFLLRPFLRAYIGITLGRTIYLAPKLLEREAAAIDATLRHELTHVQQILRLGLARLLLAVPSRVHRAPDGEDEPPAGLRFDQFREGGAGCCARG